MDASDLLKFKTIADVACSPDGSRVAYTVAAIDPEVDDYRTTIWVSLAIGGEHKQLTTGQKKDGAPRWSIYFVAWAPRKTKSWLLRHIARVEKKQRKGISFRA